jgi:HrpA-like RNA helicase
MLADTLEQCPKLKIILCSATVDNSILDLFDKKYSRDIFEVQVDRFPVKV